MVIEGAGGQDVGILPVHAVSQAIVRSVVEGTLALDGVHDMEAVVHTGESE